MKDRFDLAFGNDADSDRHGIVTPAPGLMNPNHYLAVAIDYLFRNRPGWPPRRGGRARRSSRRRSSTGWRRGSGGALVEVPVGFKWFVPGLLDGSIGFGGEESAGASFLRRDGTVWTTDKDGIVMDLLARRDPRADRQGSRASSTARSPRSSARRSTRASTRRRRRRRRRS